MAQIFHKGDYREQRRAAYPPIGEQLDAIWKALDAIADAGIDLGPAANEMRSRVRAIKEHMVKR